MWLKGEQIRLTLEESLLEEFQQFRFQGYGFRGEVLGGLSVDGLEVLYDPQAPPMQRIREIRVDGSQLDDEKSYLLGTLDLFTFGVGYKRLREGMHMEFYLPSFIRDVLAPVLNQEEEIANAHRARWMQG
jgi:hypothetical protein